MLSTVTEPTAGPIGATAPAIDHEALHGHGAGSRIFGRVDRPRGLSTVTRSGHAGYWEPTTKLSVASP